MAVLIERPGKTLSNDDAAARSGLYLESDAATAGVWEEVWSSTAVSGRADEPLFSVAAANECGGHAVPNFRLTGIQLPLAKR